MILAYLKIILALFVFLPRGYLLAYIIDRSKSFSFGFKFFVGWIFGLSAFTLDFLAMTTFGGMHLGWLVYSSAIFGQIIGFEFLIFLIEKKFLLPNFKNFIPFFQGHLKNFLAWTSLEKIVWLILILTLIIRAGSSLWTVANIPTYDFDAWNNWNFRAKVIFTEKTIPLEENHPYRFGGGISSYPLNDSLFKVWLATAAGEFEDKYINLAGIFYYLALLAIFYFSLPAKLNRLLKLVSTYLLSSVPLLYFHSHVPYADLFFAIFLFLTVGCIFYWLSGRGNSFFYISGIALAFGIWTKNEGLSVIFPLILITAIIFWLTKKINFKQLFFYWFWPIVTVLPWLAFRFIHHLDILSGDSSTFNLVFNYQFLGDIVSSIFLRSHFSILWILVFVFIILKIRPIWKSISLRYLALIIVVIFLFYNGIILFTDKAYDLSALARVNMQIVPLGILFLTFFFEKFSAKIEV